MYAITWTKTASVALVLAFGVAGVSPPSAYAGEKDDDGKKHEEVKRKNHDHDKKHGEDSRRKAKDKSDHKRYAWIKRALFKDVDLYDEQEEEIEHVMRKAHEHRKAWWQKQHKKMKGLMEEIHEARRDRDHRELAKLHMKIAELKENAPTPRKTVKKIKRKLTEEQQKQFMKNVEELKEKMERFRRHHHDARWRGDDDGHKDRHDDRGKKHNRDRHDSDGKEKRDGDRDWHGKEREYKDKDERRSALRMLLKDDGREKKHRDHGERDSDHDKKKHDEHHERKDHRDDD